MFKNGICVISTPYKTMLSYEAERRNQLLGHFYSVFA